MSELKSGSRNCSIDIFRYFCAILIVIIHTHPFENYGANINYITSQIITRIGVPFFFAVAGYFYTQKLDKGQKIFVSYIKKIFTTYFIWSCVYFLIEFITWGYGQIKGFIVSGFIDFFIKGSYYHFWFFPALIISVCAVTLFYRLKLKKLIIPAGLFLYAIGCFGCSYNTIGIKIPLLSSLYNFSDFLVIRRIFMMGLPFFICGYIVNRIRERNITLNNKTLSALLCTAFIIWLAEIYLVLRMEWQDNIIITFSLFPLVIAVMLILLNNPLSDLNNISEKCRILANFTYYSHPLVMLIIKTVNGTTPRLFMFILTVVITAVIGLVLSKFKNNRIIKTIVM